MTPIDIMSRVSVSRYIAEILSIPTREKPREQVGTYNGSGNNGYHGRTRELGTYRARCLEEKRLKREILELSAALAKGEQPGGNLRKRELRELYLRLGKVTMRRRELERLRDRIDNDFVRVVVDYRYFREDEARLPTWTQTARDVGAAVSGDELRRYICAYLETLS